MNPIFDSRQRRGLTIEQLARASGIALPRLRHLESERELPSADELRALAETLGVDPEALLPPEPT
jgi:transcriptional regulator with XRE-family HTH domain